MDKRVVKTKAKIKTAFLHLLAGSSLVDITISDLCREANVNRSTFYAHYSNVAFSFL